MALALGYSRELPENAKRLLTGFVKKMVVPRTEDGTGPVERCWDKISDLSSLNPPQPMLQRNSGHTPATETEMG